MAMPSDDKLIELLIAARDEHVRRLHAFNGRVAALAVVVSVTLFLGAILGIDALAAVDPASDSGWLLTTGAWAFAASAVLIALALVHHAGERSAAASHFEDAVARLTSGDERGAVLADLGSAMAPLLPSSSRARRGAYLATDLNGRRLGLTVRQKTFVGCALLLVASVAASLGVIAGYAPEPADDGDGDVAARAAWVAGIME